MKHGFTIIRHLRRALTRRLSWACRPLQEWLRYYTPGSYHDIIFSFSERHYHPDRPTPPELGRMFACEAGKHIYQALSQFGRVYYADHPLYKRTRLLISQNIPQREQYIKATHRVYFIPTSHAQALREILLQHASHWNLSEERIINCPSLKEVELFNLGLVQAEKIIIVGNNTTQQTFLKHGVPEKKLVVLNNAVNFNHFTPQERSSHRNIRFMVSVTHLSLRKGIPFVVKAWEHLQKEYKPTGATLEIIGDRRKRYDALDIELYKSLPGFRFTGGYACGSEEHLTTLRQTHYVICPSLSEGQSTSLLEAMSCGAVPIATRESGIDADNYGGWVIQTGSVENIADTLLEIIQQHTHAEWTRRSEIARQQIVQHHSWTGFTQKMLSVVGEYI